MARVNNVKVSRKAMCPLDQNVMKGASTKRDIKPACDAFHAARNLKVKK